MLFFNASISGRRHHIQLQYRGAVRCSDFSIYVSSACLFRQVTTDQQPAKPRQPRENKIREIHEAVRKCTSLCSWHVEIVIRLELVFHILARMVVINALPAFQRAQRRGAVHATAGNRP